MTFRVGTAGWAIPKSYGAEFPASGTHLQRYARVFNAVEINSSFYRNHKPQTYARWAASVPDGFRFSVNLLRDITHMHKLVGVAKLLDRFMVEVSALGNRLGPVLVQLPPSLKFGASAPRFFDMLRNRFEGEVVCEPRHASWFERTADDVLEHFHVARVIADPPRIPAATEAGGWRELSYRRMHGSPRIYYSKYTTDAIAEIASGMTRDPKSAKSRWCIFDNTALGEATGNAFDLRRALNRDNEQV
jgi:uncharacterized protein YecE (DUF72 family)